MNEREPKPKKNLVEGERAEELTEEEGRDLSALWEQLGSGKPLKLTQEYKAVREQMWHDSRQALMEEILPNLAVFRRNEQLEQAVTDAPEHSEQRAQAEYVLIKNYMQQLKEEKQEAYATTPVLAEKNGYNLNCVTKSALAASLCESLGMKVEAGKVAGHSVVLVEDALERVIYADPVGTVGRLETQAESRGVVKMYRLSEKEQDELGVSFSLVASTPPEIGFTEAMVGNFSRSVLEKHSDSSRQVLSENQELIVRQDWTKIKGKLFPELKELNEPEWALERERIEAETEYEKALGMRLTQVALGNKEVTQADRQQLMQRVLAQVRNTGAEDQVLLFLNNPATESLPENISEDVSRLFVALGKELNQMNTDQPRLRRKILQRLTMSFHLET